MEVWKPVPLWPEYEASDLGAVRRVGSSRALRGWSDKDGYLRIVFSRGKTRRTLSVHKAVAEAFFGLPADGLQVRHLDGDPSNNAACNLAYGTAKENADDRVRHGTNVAGDLHPRAKTTDVQVLSALGRCAEVGVAAAAAEIGLSQSALSMIRTGRTRRYLVGGTDAR